MNLDFEELDYQETPIGAVSLRRRSEPRLADRTVYEVKLGDEFLMSSLFTAGEEALARLGLRAVDQASASVVVGGLGLGHTAAAALDEANCGPLLVIEALAPVIEWHRRKRVPLGERLCADPRCRLIAGDFFALAADPAVGFDPAMPGRRFDAVLLDIDHSPTHLLHGASAPFYRADGLTRLGEHLAPGGVFAMWSNEHPAPAFLDTLRQVFARADAERVTFPNPYTGTSASCTVYRAWRGA